MPAKTIEARNRYLYWLEIPTRFQDGDPYGHVNNAVYYTWMDTVLSSMLLEKRILRNPEVPSIGLCVESGCSFFAPVSFPERVDAGLRIGHIGTSSVRYEVGLFRKQDESPAAVGHFIHVFVHLKSGRPRPLETWVRDEMARLMLQ